MLVCERLQSLMKLANKRGNEVGPEVVEEVDADAVNVVSNTQLKVGSTQLGTLQHAGCELHLLCL